VKANPSDGETRDGMLAVRVDGAGDGATIALSGELDMSNAALLSDALERVEAGAPERVTIDMSGLEFIDSTGIAVLVAAHRRLGEEALRFVHSRAVAVRRVIEVTGLDRQLIFEQEGESPARPANA